MHRYWLLSEEFSLSNKPAKGPRLVRHPRAYNNHSIMEFFTGLTGISFRRVFTYLLVVHVVWRDCSVGVNVTHLSLEKPNIIRNTKLVSIMYKTGD